MFIVFAVYGCVFVLWYFHSKAQRSLAARSLNAPSDGGGVQSRLASADELDSMAGEPREWSALDDSELRRWVDANPR